MAFQTKTGRELMEMFDLLSANYGPRHWWPADTPLEVMIGAVLTQNTNWKNVERAITNLKKTNMLTFKQLRRISEPALAEAIHPAGYYNIKARRLRNLIDFIADHHGGNIQKMVGAPMQELRQGLLSIKGIGPETADSILLYAANKPIFVIDAYTHRILNRHGLAENQSTYQELQELFMDNLPEDPRLFNEFHALIVETGKEFCRKTPTCEKCPLKAWRTIQIA